MRTKTPTSLTLLTATLLFIGALTPTANAADGTWTGGTSATWATTSNWLNGTVPGSASANADIATFNSAAYSFQPTAAGSYFLGGLVFGSTNGGTAITTATANNRLNIGSGGIQMSSGSGAVFLGTTNSAQGVNITANQTWSNDSSSLLNISRVAVDDSASPGTYTITIAGSGSGGVTVNNNLSDTNNAADATRKAAVVINVSGTGATSFSGSSTYSGGTTLTAGLLQIGASSSGSVGAVTSSPIGTGSLALNGGRISSGSGTTRTVLNALSIGGDVAIGDAVNNGGLTFSANTDLGGATRTLNLVSNATFDGVVSNGGITKTGTGQLTLSGASNNTYSGTTIVNDGTLFLAKTNGANAIVGGLTVGDGVNTDQVTLGASDQIADTVVVNFIGTNSGARGGLQLNAFNETIGGLSGGGQVQTGTTNGDSVLTLNVANATTQTSSAVLRNSGGAVSSSLSIVKTGGGTQVFSGNMTYTGTTTISAGSLIINGSLSTTNGTPGALTVASGGTLGGSGTIGAATTISGIHSPGNSPGLQTFTNGLTYLSGATFVWELNANSATGRGSSFDAVDLTGGILNIGAGVTNNLVFNAGSAVNFTDSFWTSNQQWLVFSNIGTTTLGTPGVFSTVGVSLDSIGNPTFAGATFTWSQDVNNLYLNYTVPEPSTYALLALAAAGLGARVMRRRRH